MTPMNGPKLTDGILKKRDTTIALAVGAIVVALGIGAEVKNCLDKDGDDSAEITKTRDVEGDAGNAHAPNAVRFTTTKPVIGNHPHKPDAGHSVSQTGGLVVPKNDTTTKPGEDTTQDAKSTAQDGGTTSVDKEEAIRKACQNLWDSSKGDEGSTYAALQEVKKLTDDQSPEPNDPDNIQTVIGDLGSVSKACKIQTVQLGKVLNHALDQGDTRVARDINDTIASDCLRRQVSAVIASKKAKEDCNELPSGVRTDCAKAIMAKSDATCPKLPTPEARQKCAIANGNRLVSTCGSLPDGAFGECIVKARQEVAMATSTDGRRACAQDVAKELGVDLDKVQEMDAVARASELATMRLRLFDLERPPSKDDISAYVQAMQTIIMNIGSEQLYQRLGLANENIFKTEYMDSVIPLVEKLFGKKYAQYVGNIFNFVWTHRDNLFQTVVQQVGSGRQR